MAWAWVLHGKIHRQDGIYAQMNVPMGGMIHNAALTRRERRPPYPIHDDRAHLN
ncbi:hypothetical protein SSE37_14619 [Sagittula stellata E-37]|uniref:Uncharacterized protein n=1 Tax=Sagittula stellata (strain ATCC 700073 / DSM 11524 / E-37) TaxID=388399 RepID=A3K8K7_SAGS3|nr:hypothetical protein SSE37_14619 [Sagittula stellata E-37]